jgi:hypothetical protein
MAFFIFPQRWIGPAISAAAIAFGPIPGTAQVKYFNFPGQTLAGTIPPNTIFVDKRARSAWPKWKAQCVLVHQYGHLAGRKHSPNPRSVMYAKVRYRPCKRFLVRHGIR